MILPAWGQVIDAGISDEYCLEGYIVTSKTENDKSYKVTFENEQGKLATIKMDPEQAKTYYFNYLKRTGVIKSECDYDSFIFLTGQGFAEDQIDKGYLQLPKQATMTNLFGNADE